MSAAQDIEAGHGMGKGRVEAFSDGVFAIIITILVLEIKVPRGASFADLLQLWPTFLGYLLSFIYIGIYWNNHHHLFQAVKHVRGGILWANLHLLFWLALVPFATAWMGESHFADLPVALYGVLLFAAAVAYWLLAQCLVATHGKNSVLAKALGSDVKGLVSLVIYALAIAAAFFSTMLSCAGFACVAVMWLVPDRRIENIMAPRKH